MENDPFHQVNREQLIGTIAEATTSGALEWKRNVLNLSFTIQKTIWTARTDDKAFSFECCEEDRRVKVFASTGHALVLIDHEYQAIRDAIDTAEQPKPDNPDIISSLKSML